MHPLRHKWILYAVVIAFILTSVYALKTSHKANAQAAKNYTPAIDYIFDSNTYEDMTTYVTWQTVPTTTSIFAAYQFGFQAGNGGYIGTQIYNTGSKKAIFSIWDVDGFPQSSQPNSTWCQRFGGEGLGAQCVIDYPWVVNREYKLVVHKQSTITDGEIWEGLITDTVTGTETLIGRLKVSNINAFNGFGRLNGSHSNNFHEYFAQGQEDCSLHKYSKIKWRGPYVIQGQQLASKATAVYLDCALVNMTSPSTGTIILEEGPGTTVTTPNGTVLWNITPTPTTNACSAIQGDANGDGRVSLVDYETWRRIFKTL